MRILPILEKRGKEEMKGRMNSLANSQRIETIDMIRGIAILGIFLVNMPSFYSAILYKDGYEQWTEGLDRWFYIFTDIFAQASFYPLFAFLFGFGATILYERSVEKELSFPKLFSRRMSILLFIGCIHAFLIWHGDILITYALLGFVFLLFYKINGRMLLITGAFLYLIPMVLISLLMVIGSLLSEEDMSITNTAMVEQSVLVYQTGTFAEITAQRWEDWYSVNNPFGMFIYLFAILPLLLFGAGVAKLRWLHRPHFHKKKLLKIAMISFVLGLLIKLLPYVTVYNVGITFVQDFLGGPLLTFAYIAFFTLSLQNGVVKRILQPFANVGKMSISHYLFQSVLCTFLFYSYGLGLYGQISYTIGTLMVMIIFIIQMIGSHFWLKYFQQGPVEYVWRRGTYWNKQSIKKAL